MNLRHRTLIVAFAGCVLPASAGELGLLYTKQYSKAQVFENQEYKAGDTATVGIRGGFTVVDLKVVEFSFTGTYQPKAEQDLAFNGAKVGRYGVGYAALGVQVDWKLLLNLNAGVEMRRETLSWDLPSGKDESTLNRPWARGGHRIFHSTARGQPLHPPGSCGSLEEGRQDQQPRFHPKSPGSPEPSGALRGHSILGAVPK